MLAFLVMAFVGQASKARTHRHLRKYGFYIHGFAEDAAILYQVRQLKKFFPHSPVYIMSDGGADYSELCKELGCWSEICPPANDRWHPWPFFRRMYDAAIKLNSEYVVMLEPDNTIHGPIKHEPKFDAGGLFVDQRSYGMSEYIVSLAQERVKNFQWNQSSWTAGLCGGSYFRTDALLDSISDEHMMKIDWGKIARGTSKEIYSSDLALIYAFAARGYTTGPWEDSAQMGRSKDKPVSGTMESAFRHYCQCYPGNKPTHTFVLTAEEQHLKGKRMQKYRGNKWDSNCQMCYDSDEYKQAYGSLKCTNRQQVHQEVLPSFLQRPAVRELSLINAEAHQLSLAALDARLGCPP